MIEELTRALNNKPTYLFYTVTSRCNAFCDFCWNWKNVSDAGKFAKPGKPIKRPELSLDEIDKFTRKLSSMLTVNLFGGEPFLRDDLLEIIELFIKNCQTKYISIPTNGSWPDRLEKVIGTAVQRYPNTFFKLYLSLDGPDNEHNKIRKIKDGYVKLKKSLDFLVELKKNHKNISVSCNLNFNSITQSYMENFLDEVMSWKKFDSISLDLIRGDDLYDAELLKVDVQLYEKLQKKVETYKVSSDQPYSILHKAIEQKTAAIVRKSIQNPDERVFDCNAGKKILLLTDIGEVIPCEHLLSNVMGNIRDFDYDLGLLLKSDTAKKIRQDIVDKKCNCRWDCAINNANISQLKNYPDLIFRAFKNLIHTSV